MDKVERYLAHRFEFAAPGDQQEDAWILRFCDNDRGDMIWQGEDAKQDAWAAWNQYAPGYNCYLFSLARLSDTTTIEALQAQVAGLLVVLEVLVAAADEPQEMPVGPINAGDMARQSTLKLGLALLKQLPAIRAALGQGEG